MENKLKKKKCDQKRAQKERDEKKKKIKAFLEENPELRTSLSVRDNDSRLRIEEEMPLLLGTIVDIDMYGSASHQRRQSDVYRSIKTLA